jgi:hypothetical protein
LSEVNKVNFCRWRLAPESQNLHCRNLQDHLMTRQVFQAFSIFVWSQQGSTHLMCKVCRVQIPFATWTTRHLLQLMPRCCSPAPGKEEGARS